MKRLTMIFFLFGIYNALAQNSVSYKTDTLKRIPIRWGPTRSINDSHALYVIDDKPISDSLPNHGLENINPDDILEVTVVKAASAVYGIKGANGVVIITTKGYAKKLYQNKLSAFSIDYKRYLESHQNNDEGFMYLLDGIPVQGKPEDIIYKLYKIPLDEIKDVGFNKKEATDGSSTMVIINTKQ